MSWCMGNIVEVVDLANVEKYFDTVCSSSSSNDKKTMETFIDGASCFPI